MHSIETLRRAPLWSILAPLAGLAVFAAKAAHLVPEVGLFDLVASALLIACVFASVRHAEAVAAKVGEPCGALLLALAVTCIEAGLIVSLMLADPDKNQTLARDSLFSVVMIVLNGLIGLSLVIGDWRNHRAEFRTAGTSGALVTLATLAVLTLVLPNFTAAAPGPRFSAPQLIFVSLSALALYLVFVFVQSVRHPLDFLGDAELSMGAAQDEARDALSLRRTLFNLLLLVVSLSSVVLVAKGLTPAFEAAAAAVGLPQEVIGIAVAALVLLPESISAIRAAIMDRTQTSLNLAIGSALASLGLTVPVVAAAALLTGAPLTLGVDPLNMALLLLTLFVSTMTLGLGRATVLQGAVHLTIFFVFLAFSIFH